MSGVKINLQLCGPKETGKTYPLIGFKDHTYANQRVHQLVIDYFRIVIKIS
jgi:hypothetical protein